jgi:protein TonB
MSMAPGPLKTEALQPEPEPEPPPPPKPKRARPHKPVPFVPMSTTPTSDSAPAGSTQPSAVVSCGVESGSGEEPPRFNADYLRNPKPPYPSISRRMHEEGKVILRVRVTPEGNAGSLEIRTSSGSARLDESALRTVRQWKFIPARRGNTPVQSWVLVPIVFKLE